MSRRRRAEERKAARLSRADEPAPDGDEWLEWCGELMWVAGWTSGGAPYGLRYEEWRDGMRIQDTRAGWARALSILQRLAKARGGAGVEIEVGRVTKIDDGLSRDVFGAELSVRPDAEGLSAFYAVLLPRRPDAGLQARTRKELRLLAWLQYHDVGFRVPRPLGVAPDQDGLALAREFIPGIPLELRAGRQGRIKPWEVVADIAAKIHGIEVAFLPDCVGGHATRREHALSVLESLEGLEPAEARDARAWALEHLPPADPVTLVHGDLLGQNILIHPTAELPFAVIDWEYAMRGDPAYDLAIVTRGVREPFQVPGGLDRLLESYAASGCVGLSRDHVRLHELALAGRWYREAVAQRPGEGRAPEETLALMRRILKMAGT
jgi:aminoglycoside phosphotransferase (APT) family kinase protein